MSTSSGFSSYAGSVPESPNDVDFSPPGMEQDSLGVSRNPTGLGAGPGDTMHNMAATGQHGDFSAMPVLNPLSANELQNDLFETLNQMQFDMSQVQGFNSNTTYSIPTPHASMMQSNGNPSSET
ncbi:hypothetical protein N0V85_009216 [Neurospora sp. IMI 360204]|nr:hypothetical protein N0V85_009216 [Neurospora sp. IMI 360204]